MSAKSEVCDASTVGRQTYGYLPSRRASLLCDRYQIILLQANSENQLEGEGVQCQYKAKAAETQLSSQQYCQEEIAVDGTHMQNG